MRRHRCVGAIVLFVFVAAIAAPVFAGGNDVPVIPPGAKTKTQLGTFRTNGGNDTPAIPPAGHKPGQDGSSRGWAMARLVLFPQILSVVWGGGSPSPHH
jgi:hypothetical protein